MLVVQKGKCTIPLSNTSYVERVQGVYYNDNKVYFSARNGVKIGKYTQAYFLKDGNFHQFGEIKFTVGTIANGAFKCNYVLCEY